MKDIVVGVVDVGSPKNIGWAIIGGAWRPQQGRNLDCFVNEIAEAATGERPILLGLEAPLFVPFGRDLPKVTKQREGEYGRPWSAGAGATVTTVGMAIVPFVLGKLRSKLRNRTATLDWRKKLSEADLLIFEAFVSGDAKRDSNEDDALAAAQTVWNAYPDLDELNCIDERKVFSLIEAYLVRTGWRAASQTRLLAPCLVVRPSLRCDSVPWQAATALPGARLDWSP